ncbi:MAG: hypothetical protein RL254_2059, partial [Planctomycetota bacterium]
RGKELLNVAALQARVRLTRHHDGVLTAIRDGDDGHPGNRVIRSDARRLNASRLQRVNNESPIRPGTTAHAHRRAASSGSYRLISALPARKGLYGLRRNRFAGTGQLAQPDESVHHERADDVDGYRHAGSVVAGTYRPRSPEFK